MLRRKLVALTGLFVCLTSANNLEITALTELPKINPNLIFYTPKPFSTAYGLDRSADTETFFLDIDKDGKKDIGLINYSGRIAGAIPIEGGYKILVYPETTPLEKRKTVFFENNPEEKVAKRKW